MCCRSSANGVLYASTSGWANSPRNQFFEATGACRVAAKASVKAATPLLTTRALICPMQWIPLFTTCFASLASSPCSKTAQLPLPSHSESQSNDLTARHPRHAARRNAHRRHVSCASYTACNSTPQPANGQAPHAHPPGHVRALNLPSPLSAASYPTCALLRAAGQKASQPSPQG
jgi:hypothetical protein